MLSNLSRKLVVTVLLTIGCTSGLEIQHNVNNVYAADRLGTILPNNDRHQIFNTLEGHYQSVCFIYVNNSTQGSGVVVGPNTVLTNRHVANAAKNGEAKNIRVAAARESKTNAPYGSFEASDFVVNKEEDLAVVHVKPKSSGSIGAIFKPAKIVNNPSTQDGSAITVTGYPGDKPFATMWESRGKVVDTNNDAIRYNASTYPGNSGSPVFNDKNEVVGIHYGGTSTWNVAVRFSPAIYNFIEQNMK